MCFLEASTRTSIETTLRRRRSRPPQQSQLQRKLLTLKVRPRLNTRRLRRLSGSLNEVKNSAVSPTGDTAKNVTPKKGEKAKSNEKAAAKEENPEEEPTPDADGSFMPVTPNAPNVNIPDFSRPNRSLFPRNLNPQVRTLPDGTQITTFADGTRLVKCRMVRSECFVRA